MAQQWKKLDKRHVVDKSAGAMVNWLRVMAKPKTKVRRAYDRSQLLLEAGLVERCTEGPFATTGEEPCLDDLYHVLLDVMENHVPATLGPTDQWLLDRLLATLARMLAALDLGRERQALRQAAARIEEAAEGQPGNQPGKQVRRNTNPIMEERLQGLLQSWNSLGLSPETLRRPHQVASAWLATQRPGQS
ncbi:unnamed protein product [Ixodes hexagonus]